MGPFSEKAVYAIFPLSGLLKKIWNGDFVSSFVNTEPSILVLAIWPTPVPNGRIAPSTIFFLSV